MYYVRVWDEVSPINGIPAERVLSNRQDLVAAHGDIFLVLDAYDRVTEIQIGSVIASNYGMAPGLSLQEIADFYLVKKDEEQQASELEQLTTEELQGEVATLSYEVMVLNAQVNNVAQVLDVAEGERSPKFKVILNWYRRGYWTEDMVSMAVQLGQILESEKMEIIGE